MRLSAADAGRTCGERDHPLIPSESRLRRLTYRLKNRGEMLYYWVRWHSLGMFSEIIGSRCVRNVFFGTMILEEFVRSLNRRVGTFKRIQQLTWSTPRKPNNGERALATRTTDRFA